MQTKQVLQSGDGFAVGKFTRIMVRPMQIATPVYTVVVVDKGMGRQIQVVAVGPQPYCIADLFTVEVEVRIVRHLPYDFTLSKETPRRQEDSRFRAIRGIRQRDSP